MKRQNGHTDLEIRLAFFFFGGGVALSDKKGQVKKRIASEKGNVKHWKSEMPEDIFMPQARSPIIVGNNRIAGFLLEDPGKWGA